MKNYFKKYKKISRLSFYIRRAHKMTSTTKIYSFSKFQILDIRDKETLIVSRSKQKQFYTRKQKLECKYISKQKY